MQDLQLSLVSSGGILLASKPESRDETKQVLASGLISAILTFAREVHQEDLQSLSYFDRNVSFVRVHDFIIIIETIVEEETFSERQLKQLLEQVKLSTSPLLEERDPNMLSFGEAALILEHCFHDINSLQLFFTKNPLLSAEPSKITIRHKVDGYEIIDKVGVGSHIGYLASMVHSHIDFFRLQNNLIGAIFLLPEQKYTVYTVISRTENISEIGFLRFPRELDFTLFRIVPILDEKLLQLSEQNITDVLDVLDNLQKIEDPGIRFSGIKTEDISLSFLANVIEKNLGKAIYSVITGRPVYVIGARSTVRLIIDILSVFTQHFSVNFHDWVTLEDIEEKKSCSTPTMICGMSAETFEKLESMNSIESHAAIVNLNTGFVDGEFDSTYFLNILESKKSEDIDTVSVLIFHELRKLVSMSFIITSFALQGKEEAKSNLLNFIQHAPFPESFIKKAIELAVKCNFIVKHLI
ncbi:MAG: hypothetical protein ACW96U_10830 [Candidatus Heimdallarchaeaceae archaeon]|jgi:hypothetical protein